MAGNAAKVTISERQQEILDEFSRYWSRGRNVPEE